MKNVPSTDIRAKKELRRQPGYARRKREEADKAIQRAYRRGFKDGRHAEAMGSPLDD